MKRVWFVVLAACSMTLSLFADEVRLIRYPDIADDGRIVFTYEDDLWLLPAGSSRAVRLTSHPGKEARAKFSPDGQSIAFAASYDGNPDVYLIPASGGTPQRLTYSHSGARIVDWTADGRFIYILMAQRMYNELYRIPAGGGAPERIPIGEVSECAVSRDQKTVVYTPSSASAMNWRGYRGGRQPDLYITDLQGTRFEKITPWDGYDCQPLYFRDRILFLSDRKHNRMNLYTYDAAGKTATSLTDFTDWDVEEPSASGNAVVFTMGGWLYKYDGIKTEKVALEMESDHWLSRPYYINPGQFVNEIVPDNGGEITYVEARGDIFRIAPEEGEPVNLTATPGSREMMPSLSPDGQWLAFYSDKTGEYELYVMAVKKGSPWQQITRDKKTFYYHIVWSPDSKKLLFNDKEYQLYWADVASKKVTSIDRAVYQRDNEIYWEHSDYDWSADSKWIAYSKCAFNMNSSIYLYNTETAKIYRLTDDRYDDLSPAFDRNGKYLFFLSNRNFEPELDPMMDNHINVNMSRIMVVSLQDGLPVPFSREEKSTPNEPLKRGIEIQNIQKRIFTVPINSGTYLKLTARENRFYFLSKSTFGFPGDESYAPKSTAIYTLNAGSSENLAVTKIIDPVTLVYHVSADGKHVGYIGAGTGGVISTETESSVGTGALNWGYARMLIEPEKEYTQIINDVWLQVRNYFYDPGIHGLDWKAIGEKYRALVPYCASRQDLNYVMGKMVAELGVSHMYVWRPGDVQRQNYPRAPIACLGADLVPAGKYYQFAHILQTPNADEDTRNPLLAPNIKLKDGDYLLAIDGQTVTTEEDYGKYLIGKAGLNVQLTVNDKPSLQGAWTIETTALSDDYLLRYKERIERNYEKVQSATKGAVGYFHISDCDLEGLKQFEQGFRAERFRDGLIIDVRGNGGGFDSYMMIDKIERALMYVTQTRNFEPMHYPHGIIRGPVVMLCDEKSGSDGDLIVQHFKDRKLGTTIGTRTWGGLIGIINFQDLIDGGMVTQVNVGFANLNGEWVVENKGVTPDLIVENNPGDLEKGIDAQLNKAIEVVLEQIKNKPPKTLKAPAYPKR